MAEILVKAIEVPHFDPNNIDPGWYRPGDPVVVFENGHEWGREEGLPTFWIVKVTRMSVDEARIFIEEKYSVISDPENPVMLQRRRYKMDKAKLSPALENQLNTTGTITISKTQALNAIKVKP